MSEWVNLKISDFATIVSGATPATNIKEYWDGVIVWITPNDLSKLKSRFIDTSERKISFQGLKSASTTITPARSVVMSSRAPIGYFGIPTEDFTTNQGCKSFVFSDEHDAEFHYYNFVYHSDLFKRYGSGSTFMEISKSNIEKLSFLIPVDIRVQRKIAKILSTVDEVIEKTEAAIEKYQAIKAGMMQDLFTRGIDPKSGKLRPTIDEAPELYKESELGWIPKEWDLRILSKFNISIVDGDRGRNYPHDNELHEDGYCLFLNASNVTINGFEFSKMSFITKEKEDSLGSGKLVRNDVIVTTRGTVGNIAYYSDDILYEHMRINSGMLILRNCENGLTSEFLYLSLKNYFFDIGFKRVVSGSAQPQLPMKDLKSFLIIKPSQSEQKVIVDRIFSLDNEIEKEKCYLQKMSLIKQGLMADLLTGKVRVIKMNNKVENG